MGAAIRRNRRDEASALFEIWRAAVLASHHFLSARDFADIERLVRDDYLPTADLWVAAGADDGPLGFMGMSGAHVDSLFVAPSSHGRGVGSALIAHARLLHRALTVDVNEQNEGALAFYRRLGFDVTGRSQTDDQGRPYPLLRLRSGAGLALDEALR